MNPRLNDIICNFVTALCLMSTTLLPVAALAGTGGLDLSFDSGTGVNASVNAIAVQDDGKIIIGGDFTNAKGLPRNGVARLNIDGSVDTTFIPPTTTGTQVSAIAVQADGKVLLGGGIFGNVNGSAVARLNADGSLDATFAPEIQSFGIVTAIAVQADGKTLIAGSSLTRLNVDGSLDVTFSASSFAYVYSLALQTDGKVIVGGSFSIQNGGSRNGIARLNSNGTLDASFNTGTGADDWVYSVVEQDDGKILIGGKFKTVNGTNRGGIARLNSDGSLDTTFHPVSGAKEGAAVVAVQADGMVLIGGTFSMVNGISRYAIARLKADGGLDASFAPIIPSGGAIATVALQADGRILIGGATYFTAVNGTNRNHVARLNADGSLDTSFDPGTGADGISPFASGQTPVTSVVAQPDGAVLIGGSFTAVNGTSRNRIARLGTDGILDPTFDPGLGANDQVNSVALQADGKVVIAGRFTAVNGITRNRIARLNADGTLDAIFDPASGPNAAILAIAVQDNDRVLIGGSFTAVGSVSRRYVARLNADGSLDTGFDPGTVLDQPVYAVLLQPDGKVLLGGYFSGGLPHARGIMRLNTDGSMDPDFNPGQGVNGAVNSIAQQSDGKILIAGAFSMFDGAFRSNIARLNADGSLDTTVDPGSGVSSSPYSATIYSIAAQPDDKVLIGGYFNQVQDTLRTGIARLEADGSFLDGAFDPGAGALTVYSISLQEDGKVLIGGSFTTVNGVPRGYVARLIGVATDTPTNTPTATSSPTPLRTATPTRTASSASFTCFGDCDGNEAVDEGEIVEMVSIALGSSDSCAMCRHGIPDDVVCPSDVTVAEIVRAVNIRLGTTHCSS